MGNVTGRRSMAVLVEALSVIVQNRTIEEKYAGGMAAYRADCPNGSFCNDEYLSCVLFTMPFDVGQFVQPLMKRGFRFVEDGQAQEIVVVDQHDGPTAPCRWLKVGDHPDGFRYAALASDLGDRVAKPQGWTLERSLTIEGRKVSHETLDGMRWLRTEGSKEIYWDEERQKEMEIVGPSDHLGPRERYRRQLVTRHGDGVRPLWSVSPNGRVVALGRRRVREIADLQARWPMIGIVIGPIIDGDRGALVSPLKKIGRGNRLPRAQRLAMWKLSRPARVAD